MGKPKSRCNGLCSSLTTVSQVRAGCDCLSPGYDLSGAIKLASEIFYVLAGSQQRFAGQCTHVVYPDYPGECSCLPRNFQCRCKLDSVSLPNVCEVERITVDGLVVDPRTYVVGADRVLRTSGDPWPLRQAVSLDASPIHKYVESPLVVSPSTLNVSASRRTNDGCFDLWFDPGFSFVVSPPGHVFVFTGDDGWQWPVAVDSLTRIDDTHYVLCQNTEHSGEFADVLTAADGTFERQLSLKPTQPYNTVFTLENVTVDVRVFFVDPHVQPVDDCGLTRTFEIVYKTGCCVPFEVSEAVSRLACEIALAAAGSDKCRLPSNLKSFKLDGDLITRDDQYKFITHGMTGLPEVDQIIKLVNPNGLRRRSRIISAPPVGRKVRRVR